MFTNIDAQIQAGNPPDVFRVPYYTFGAYAGAGQLLDLSDHLESGFADRFTPQAWAAVQNEGSPFGVPHHTDTSVILYNADLLSAAGIDEVPQSLEEAWTWEEFAQVAETLRGRWTASKFPFAYNWQGNGVTRWLSWLFESDGRFLAEDLLTPAIDSDAGRPAVEFTQSFFTKALVPPNSSVKSTTYAADLWYAQTVAMTFGGAFLLPDTDATVDFEWGATYSPRNVRAGGDFGGNALVATAGTEPRAGRRVPRPRHPGRADARLLRGRLPAADPHRPGRGRHRVRGRGDLAPVFLGQASTVQAEDSGQVASPSMSRIITVLQDQLESAFVGGQDVETHRAGPVRRASPRPRRGEHHAGPRAARGGAADPGAARRDPRGVRVPLPDAGPARAVRLRAARLGGSASACSAPTASATAPSSGSTTTRGCSATAGSGGPRPTRCCSPRWSPRSRWPLGLAAALLLNSALPARPLFRAVLILPMAVSGVATALIGLLIFDENTGVARRAPARAWACPRSTGSPAASGRSPRSCWSRCGGGSGFNMLIYLTGLQGLDPQLTSRRCSTVRAGGSGCVTSRCRCCGPSTFFLLIINVIYSFQVFDIVFVLTGGGPQDATSVLVTYAYEHGFTRRDQGYGAALGMVLLLVTLAFTAVQWRTSRGRDEVG